MNQEREDIADQQTFGKGDPEHLVLLRPNRCLIRLMNVLCHRKTELVFLGIFAFLDFLLIHPSCP